MKQSAYERKYMIGAPEQAQFYSTTDFTSEGMSGKQAMSAMDNNMSSPVGIHSNMTVSVAPF